MTADNATTRIAAGTLKLAAFAMIAAAIVAGAWQLTNERIERNQQALQRAQFEPVLAAVTFDAIGYNAAQKIIAPHTLPGDSDAMIYPVIRNGATVARVFEVDARGYNGPIRLLIGIDPANVVTGVRVIAHQETPGLGDAIERQRSDWIESFRDTSLSGIADDGWALKRNGGQFDGFTGASITPRAVVLAVRDTLRFAEQHPIVVVQP